MSDPFSPIHFGELSLPNRFVRSATWEGLADENGFVRPELEHRMAELAAHGVGLIVCGYLYVSPEGRGLPWQSGIFLDAHMQGLRRMVDAVHRNGGLIAAQIAHAGGRTRPETIGGTPLAPSAIEGMAFGHTPQAMTRADIDAVAAAFGRAAGRAQAAGFDAVQLHAAHGYLLSQFLSPLFNHRTDAYGGSPTRRRRLLIEVWEAVRRAVGPGYPVFVKINSSDGPDGGISVAEALETAADLAARGLCAVEVSGGMAGSTEHRPSRRKIKTPDQEAYFRTAAALFKSRLDVPVILVGGIKSFATAQAVLARGDADAVALSRPLICEPDLVSRWRSGDTAGSRCTSCNLCLQEGLKGGGIACVGKAQA